MAGCEPEQGVFDVVSGQDQQRPIGRQAKSQQGLTQSPDRVERLLIGDPAPRAVWTAPIAEENPLLAPPPPSAPAAR